MREGHLLIHPLPFMDLKLYATSLLLCLLAITASAQFPTATGTKWEYFQYYETMIFPPMFRWAFTDEIIGDTVAGGNTYQVVSRSGDMYNAFGSSASFEPMTGHWYLRVDGNYVYVLDSVSAGVAMESVLYDFGTPLNDTSSVQPKSLIEMTPLPNPGWYLRYHSRQYICQNTDSSFCGLAYVREPWGPFGSLPIASNTWGERHNSFWTPDFGTVFEEPFMITLDVYGQHFLLGRLSSGGNVLYEHPDARISQAADPIAVSVELFPNPATTTLRLRADAELGQAMLVDAQGRVLMGLGTLAPGATHTVSTSALPSGVCWLVAMVDGQTVSKAVLIH